jgi:translation elongation factor EF-G
MSGGRGIYTMVFDHYETVPANVAQPIIAAHKHVEEA